MQKLLSKMRQAINDFNLIENGESFDLIAITLNPGGVDNSPLHKLCEELEVPL